MHIAIEGCCHGELDKIYASLKLLEKRENIKVDILIICGDFQSIRNLGDLDVMACPEKHRALGNFHEYYSGKKVAPILTIFIGGNHEASNYLWELYHGGWVCPNIYFLGFAGVLNFGGLRIAGLTGIYNQTHYEMGFCETQPLSSSDSRSIYHVRKYNVYRIAQLRKHIDIFVSHDWPRGIAKFGNLHRLITFKKHLAEEIHNNTLGSYPNEFLMKRLKPSFWFSAHLHVKFSALVRHPPDEAEKKPVVEPAAPAEVGNPDEIPIDENPDEIVIEDVDEEEINDVKPATNTDEAESKAEAEEVAKPTETIAPTTNNVEKSQEVDTVVPPAPKYTRFLSLDKCLPNREFLQVIELPHDAEAPLRLSYDPEWLAIVKATAGHMSFSRIQPKMPPEAEMRPVIEKEFQWVMENIQGDALMVPENFVMSSPPHLPDHNHKMKHELAKAIQNPQTVAFCELLQIPCTINPNSPVSIYTPKEAEGGDE